MPQTWRAYGVDADGDGVANPDAPADAIFAAARYLEASGASTDLRGAIFAYNHADWYVDEVLELAGRIAAMPEPVVSSLSGLATAGPPVAAPIAPGGALASERLGRAPGARSCRRDRRCGRCRRTTRAVPGARQLRDPARRRRQPFRVQPAREARARVRRVRERGGDHAQSPGRPAAGPSPRAPLRASDAARRLARRRARAVARGRRPHARADRGSRRRNGGAAVAAGKGGPMRRGARIAAGTVIASAPHKVSGVSRIRFAVRPAGRDAPTVDPRPLLRASQAMRRSGAYRALNNATAAPGTTAPKAVLQRRVLEDPAWPIYPCGREDIRAGRIDARVLATRRPGRRRAPAHRDVARVRAPAADPRRPDLAAQLRERGRHRRRQRRADRRSSGTRGDRRAHRPLASRAAGGATPRSGHLAPLAGRRVVRPG